MNKPQDKRLRLARRFRKQQTFSQKSSPLSAAICGLVADLLSPESQDEEIASWLLTASEGQTSFAVPMLPMRYYAVIQYFSALLGIIQLLVATEKLSLIFLSLNCTVYCGLSRKF